MNNHIINEIKLNNDKNKHKNKYKDDKYKNDKDNEITLTKSEIKEYGIYFTPKDIIKNILSKLSNYEFNKILEPSCGDGAFLNYLIKKYKNITACELNDKIFKYVKNIPRFNKIKFIHDDYLNLSIKHKYDLIIGNPPYFVHNSKLYNEYYTGRTNIFIQFIIHSLMKLNKNGILAFVIPETFLNCQYYLKTRLFIKDNFKILNIYKNPDTFKCTNYSTITIIIQNINDDLKCNINYFYNDNLIYNNELIKLLNIPHYKLNEIEGIEIGIGKFVFNQHKDILINIDNSIKNNLPVLIYNPNDTVRRNYVNISKDSNECFDKNLIIINRGYGNSKYKLKVELINSEDYPNKYILENHIIYIYHENIEILNKIYNSLNNDNTQKFIDIFITNGAISVKDLKENICLYD